MESNIVGVGLIKYILLRYGIMVYIMSIKLQRTNAKTNKMKRANDFILIAGISGIID